MTKSCRTFLFQHSKSIRSQFENILLYSKTSATFGLILVPILNTLWFKCVYSVYYSNKLGTCLVFSIRICNIFNPTCTNRSDPFHSYLVYNCVGIVDSLAVINAITNQRLVYCDADVFICIHITNECISDVVTSR